MQNCSVQHQTFTYTTRNIHNWTSFLLWPSHLILCGAIVNSPLLFPSSKLGIPSSKMTLGFIFRCHIFFPCPSCSLFSPGKDTGVGCHFLLEWTTFCQNSSLWPVWLVWPCMSWLLASLSYTCPFIHSLWSMKRIYIVMWTYKLAETTCPSFS